jgi:hypothetical protein
VSQALSLPLSMPAIRNLHSDKIPLPNPHVGITIEAKLCVGRLDDMDEDLEGRIQQMYSAISDAEQADIDKLPGTVNKTETIIFVRQDFSGGQNQMQIVNRAQSVIVNIAYFSDISQIKLTSLEIASLWDTADYNLAFQ